jgi:hypothetical protein
VASAGVLRQLSLHKFEVRPQVIQLVDISRRGFDFGNLSIAPLLDGSLSRGRSNSGCTGCAHATPCTNTRSPAGGNRARREEPESRDQHLDQPNQAHLKPIDQGRHPKSQGSLERGAVNGGPRSFRMQREIGVVRSWKFTGLLEEPADALNRDCRLADQIHQCGCRSPDRSASTAWIPCAWRRGHPFRRSKGVLMRQPNLLCRDRCRKSPVRSDQY